MFKQKPANRPPDGWGIYMGKTTCGDMEGAAEGALRRYEVDWPGKKAPQGGPLGRGCKWGL